MRSQRQNYPHIDVAHVALVKVDANYIAVNCSCILPKFRSQYVTYQLKNHIDRYVRKYIYYKQDDVRLAIAHQIKSRRAI